MDIYYDFFNNNINKSREEIFANLKKHPREAVVSTGEFFINFNCLQSWYMRVSTIEKLNFLKEIFMSLKDNEMLFNFVCMYHAAVYEKLLAYNLESDLYSFPYDSSLDDNSRTIEAYTSSVCYKRYLEWHRNLHEEFQIEVYTSLIRLGGGDIARRVYQFTTNYYTNFPFKILTVKHEDNAHTANKRETKKVESITETPADPFVNIISEKIKNWNEIVLKYKHEVEGKPKNEAKEGKKKSKGKDKKNKKKSSKNSSKQSKKSNKSGKSSKSKKGKKEFYGKDYIQAMPIWIVKQIFFYLDKKTLQKIKEVNMYWNWAASEVEQDLKIKKSFDNMLAKMEKNVNRVKVPMDPIKSISKCELKSRKLFSRGTLLPEIRSDMKIVHKPYKKSLLASAVKELNTEYALPISFLRPTPRQGLKYERDCKLHKDQPCILNETGYRKKSSLTSLEPIGDIGVFENIKVDYSARSIEMDPNDPNIEEYRGSFVFYPQSSETNVTDQKVLDQLFKPRQTNTFEELLQERKKSRIAQKAESVGSVVKNNHKESLDILTSESNKVLLDGTYANVLYDAAVFSAVSTMNMN